ITDLESARQPKSPGISEIKSSGSGKTYVSRTAVIRCGSVTGEGSFQFVQRQQRQSKTLVIKSWFTLLLLTQLSQPERQRNLRSADTP
ncbi:hypothetical protein ACE6ED_06715, partial [Paenibacillus sp. CN-4]|uniref:hypothetical protein n=1 Tax=Paenibacillus nanchangensis TaxID=3348343 RepID=UPI00397AAFF1